MCLTRLVLLVVLFIILEHFMVESKTFNYPRYAYRKKSKSERRFKSDRTRCENTANCAVMAAGLDKIICARKCQSDKCYEDIYAFDELEEGEVDVRLPSFKGCWTSEYAVRHKIQ